jgi:hypothetical protein
MRATRIIAIISVIGVAMAAKHSLKQKLAERGNTLAQTSVMDNAAAERRSWDDCDRCEERKDCGCSRGRCPVLHNNCDEELKVEDCNCTPGAIGLDFPLLGEGDFAPTSVKTVLSSNQEQVFEATPDSSFNAFDESACCSCENALHQSAANATKIRRFGIHGDICVTECIQYEENGCADEASLGRSKKNSIHQENIFNGGLGGGDDNCTNFTLSVCAPPNIVVGHP